MILFRVRCGKGEARPLGVAHASAAALSCGWLQPPRWHFVGLGALGEGSEAQAAVRAETKSPKMRYQDLFH